MVPFKCFKIFLEWYKNEGRGNGMFEICLRLKARSTRLRKSALGRSISHHSYNQGLFPHSGKKQKNHIQLIASNFLQTGHSTLSLFENVFSLSLSLFYISLLTQSKKRLVMSVSYTRLI